MCISKRVAATDGAFIVYSPKLLAKSPVKIHDINFADVFCLKWKQSRAVYMCTGGNWDPYTPHDTNRDTAALDAVFGWSKTQKL